MKFKMCRSEPDGLRRMCRAARAGDDAKRSAKIVHGAVGAGNYSDVCEPWRYQGDKLRRGARLVERQHHTARPTHRSRPLPDTTLWRVVNQVGSNTFNDLPLLLAVPRAAQLLGISRAAAYRLAASGELPIRRLGGRVYVVTAGLRELAS